jgi:hypothetical protein
MQMATLGRSPTTSTHRGGPIAPMATVNRHVAAIRPGMVLVVAAIAALALREAGTHAKETGR